MSLENRNKIVPQMAEYDRVGDQWVPYLMRADAPLKTFPSVSTNRWGLRNTISSEGEVVGVDTVHRVANNKTIGAVVGSSAVFGVGSTHDRHTIPSFLNKNSDSVWLNFGGRAFNSTQELIMLMLHLPKQLDRLVIFSGVNNITLAFLSPTTSPVYNSFFSQSAFEHAMANPSDDYIGVRRAWKRLLKEVRHRCWMPEAQHTSRQSIDVSYQDVLTCFERDLRVCKKIADGLGIPLYFALQPLASWMNKQLSKEEVEIFEILDSMSMDWQILAKQIVGMRDKYFADVERICRETSVGYCNLNLAQEFQTKEWLFVDRVHLTDKGCELAANILKKEFGL